MLHRPASRQRLVQELVAHVVDAGQAGIVLDFEQVPDKSQRDFRNFIGELEAGLHGADLKLMVALPAADWAYDYAAVSRECDAIVLMNYDDHWLTSAPGPIAPQDWFTTNIEKMLKLVPREKIIMGIANYAYDWPDAKGRAAHEAASPQTFRGGRRHRLGIRGRLSNTMRIRSIRTTPTTTNMTTCITFGCSTASPPTTNCAPPSVRAFAARRFGAWARKTHPSGPSGTSPSRTMLPAGAWPKCRPDTISSSKARVISGVSAPRRKRASGHFASIPPRIP